MAKTGKVTSKKIFENIIHIDGDEQAVKGVADAFLLAIDDIQRKTVTVDAGGAYVEIVGAIVDGGGDYARKR